MFDYVAFHSSAARATPGAKVVPAPGDDIYKIDKTYYLIPRGTGKITQIAAVTAGIANLASAKARKVGDENYIDIRLGISDQTGARRIQHLSYGFTPNDLLEGFADNGNNAQVDSIGLVLARDGKGISEVPFPGTIPDNARWVFGSHGSTMTANTWTKGTMTWQPVFELEKTYKIHALMCQGATMYHARLRHVGASPNVADRPGCPGHDTAALSVPYYGDFGQFKGNQPPDLEALCSGADTAGYVAALVSGLK